MRKQQDNYGFIHAQMLAASGSVTRRWGRGNLDPDHCFPSACELFFSFCKILEEPNNQRGWEEPKVVLMLISSH